MSYWKWGCGCVDRYRGRIDPKHALEAVNACSKHVKFQPPGTAFVMDEHPQEMGAVRIQWPPEPEMLSVKTSDLRMMSTGGVKIGWVKLWAEEQLQRLKLKDKPVGKEKENNGYK